MSVKTKILIAGVGGQGIVYLTNILVEAAMISDISVSVSEIHGLSQRGGVVTAGIGLGENCSGFMKNAGVDFLIGLEPLETQRCLNYLHKNSCVVFGNYKMLPYSVNAGTSVYPDIVKLMEFLKSQCRKVVFVENFPESIDAVNYNLYLLGKMAVLPDFPLSANIIERAIENIVEGKNKEKSLRIFKMGLLEETTI
ncbi:MAG: 2-oxoacid:acceptor oxidoreductase family protein [Bacteroidia bacterium]|nr:2-oxoacid:acceptor oxidoreductase family protein [Bacteroidia bacterium]